MTFRHFEFTENIPIEEDRELHAQFKHHLDHVVKGAFKPGSREQIYIVSGRDSESVEEIFGGEDQKFMGLYYIDEIEN